MRKRTNEEEAEEEEEKHFYGPVSALSSLLALFCSLLTKFHNYPHFTSRSHFHKATQYIQTWLYLIPEPTLLALVT